MLQAGVFDCLFFDPFPLSENGFVASEVDVSRCDVVQAFVVTLVVVVLDEGFDLAFEITRQIVVFQQYPVLHGLMPAFYLTLGLRVEWSTTDMIHILPLQPNGQVARCVTRPVITEQTRFVLNDRLIAA